MTMGKSFVKWSQWEFCDKFREKSLWSEQVHLKDIKPRESACCYWTLSQILGIPNVNARKAYLQTELSRQFKISLRRKTFFCSNNMNINIIATSKVRQDVEEFSRLAAKVGADFTAGHHVGVAAASNAFRVPWVSYLLLSNSNSRHCGFFQPRGRKGSSTPEVGDWSENPRFCGPPVRFGQGLT